MKEKALGESNLNQSNKVLDYIEGEASMEEVCAGFNHCDAEHISDFQNRMLCLVTGEKPKKKEQEPEIKIKKSGSYLGSKSLKG